MTPQIGNLDNKVVGDNLKMQTPRAANEIIIVLPGQNICCISVSIFLLCFTQMQSDVPNLLPNPFCQNM